MKVIKAKRLIILLIMISAVITIAVTAHNSVQTLSQQASTTQVPIIMYHSILKNSNRGKYIVTPSAFEEDLKYLNKNGYTAIVFQDLIDYVYEGTDLPEKPVILTFDDGYYNNYVYIYPLLKQYDSRAVISIVGAYTDLYTENADTNANYAHLSWDKVRELAGSGYVEIQNHTYNMHSLDKGRKGCKRKDSETPEEYKAALSDDIGSLQEKCITELGKAPTVFTYPFGLVSSESLDVVKELGFKASLSCEEGINELERRPEQLFLLKRCIRTPQRSAEDIFNDYL